MATIEDSQHNYDICMQGNCSSCPSYPRDSKEGLFCVRGPSQRPLQKRGCSCPECPIWIENGLSGMYYCMKPAKK